MTDFERYLKRYYGMTWRQWARQDSPTKVEIHGQWMDGHAPEEDVSWLRWTWNVAKVLICFLAGMAIVAISRPLWC